MYKAVWDRGTRNWCKGNKLRNNTFSSANMNFQVLPSLKLPSFGRVLEMYKHTRHKFNEVSSFI